jgi:alpha-mannosidase
MPHEGDWRKGGVPQAANSFTTPLRAIVATTHTGELPPVHAFLTCDNPEFLVTALKKAEYDNAVVVRGYNPTGESIEVALTLPESITSVSQVTLEEKPMKDLPLANNQVRLTVGRGEIATLMLKSR